MFESLELGLNPVIIYREHIGHFVQRFEVRVMCRNIRVLYNFDPPTTHEEVRDAALQYVRKISGFAKPSAANEAAFNRTVEKIAHASSALLESLVTAAPPRNRDAERVKARARAAVRFGVKRRIRHT
jgi:hypothetical protein